jgi:DNA helicase-2/ATP-dependent DNA helicase PcrA
VSNVQAVLIDEYQDTNGVQYDLMKLFSQKRHRITIVGDPDQSIYGWRSAEIKNLYRLLREYPETDEISLEENYRSSQRILDMSLQVIQQDKTRYQKVLVPVHNKGTRPVLRKLKSSFAEGDWIVCELKRVIAMFGGAIKNEDVAILLRSASLSRHVETALGKAGISYRMIGGHKFYERKEIKILLDYLRVVCQPDNNDALARIINVPRRGIGEATIKSLLEEAEKSKLSLWALLWRHCRGGLQAKTKIRASMEQKLNTELLKVVSALRQKVQELDCSDTMTLVDVVDQLVNQLNFQKYLETEYQEDHEQRWANVQELLSLANDFERDHGNAEDEALPNINNVEQEKEESVLGKFLANVALAADAQVDDEKKDTASQVTISTIHAAKGLEWPMVFVPSVYEGSIPHSRAEDMDEERRLLYVAMTRAKALLYLSCPVYGSQGPGKRVELSPFVSSFAESFSNQGPSLNRPVVESVGSILGRAVPSEKSILDKLPAGFCFEDTQFPIDPCDSDNFGDAAPGANGMQNTATKRQKTRHSSDGDAAAKQERPWKPDYATTMEQSAAFTMSSLPGFVSAGLHRTAIAASGVDAKPSHTAEYRGGGAKQGAKTTTKRRPDQRSLLGFVTTESKPAAAAASSVLPRPGPTDYSLARYQAAASRAARQAAPQPIFSNRTNTAMEPELANHKIAEAKPISRPTVMETRQDPGSKRYACFSSSPARQTSPEPQAEAQDAATVVSSRPATSFHSTTFSSINPARGVRRPVGLGPPPSMDRLRKPFKPLTINRPRGPPPNRS